MKFSKSTLAFLYLTASITTNAFQTPSSFITSQRNTALFSTTEKETEKETDVAATKPKELEKCQVLPIDLLPPDYNMARKQALKHIHDSGHLPEYMEEPLSHFLTEYMVASSANPECDAESTMKRFLGAIQLGMKYGLGHDKYTFGTTHTALRGGEPNNPEGDVDFYEFGCGFFRPVMNVQQSLVLGEDNAKRAFEQIAKGENVVFLANHQSEADPQVFSCLLETIGYGKEAADIVYVAGHKVRTDPLAIPFSMGRNLLCIHSKKHIDAEPAYKKEKQKENLATMSEMLKMMKRGGLGLWVAPSGGRDRRNVETKEIPIAAFDQKTIDMFRLMSVKSKTPTHFYPLAMVSYDLCPPPDFIDAGVGEQRNVRYVPVGIAVGDELENVGGAEKRHLFTEHAEEACRRDYEQLVKGIEEIKDCFGSAVRMDGIIDGTGKKGRTPPPPPL